MKTTEHYTNMDEVLVQKQLLRAACSVQSERMKAHLNTIRDPELRKELIGNSIHEIIGSIAPLKALRAAFGGNKGLAGNVMGMVLGATGKTVQGKATGWLAGIVLPAVAKAFMHSERGQKIIHELGRSWERIRNRLSGEHEEA